MVKPFVDGGKYQDSSSRMFLTLVSLYLAFRGFRELPGVDIAQVSGIRHYLSCMRDPP